MSIFLAKFLGVIFIFLGISMVVKRKSFQRVFGEAVSGPDPFGFMIFAIIEFVSGLAIVLLHNVWTFDYRGLITFFGLWMVIEGLLYLVLPEKVTDKAFEIFNRAPLYILSGGTMFLIGLYLASKGFGIF